MDLPEIWKEFNGMNRHVIKYSSIIKLDTSVPSLQILEQIHALLKDKLNSWSVKLIDGQSVGVESVVIKIDAESTDKKFCITWENQDEDLGRYIIGLLQTIG